MMRLLVTRFALWAVVTMMMSVAISMAIALVSFPGSARWSVSFVAIGTWSRSLVTAARSAIASPKSLSHFLKRLRHFVLGDLSILVAVGFGKSIPDEARNFVFLQRAVAVLVHLFEHISRARMSAGARSTTGGLGVSSGCGKRQANDDCGRECTSCQNHVVLLLSVKTLVVLGSFWARDPPLDNLWSVNSRPHRLGEY